MKDRKPNRMAGYDYSSPGAYFITINSRDKGKIFGHIDNKLAVLNSLGKIAEESWNNIPQHFPGIELDAMVVMPDHIHGIIIIPETGELSLIENDRSKQTLPKIVNQYKAAVTRDNNRSECPLPFTWQKSYYDRIIRNERELNLIRRYIIENPIRYYYRMVKESVP